MRTKAVMTLALLLGALSTPATAVAQGGLESRLFSPELIMKFSSEVDLTDAQRETIREEIKAMQADVVDLQWQMQEEATRLDELLEGTTVDVDAVVEQADRVLRIEWQVKKRHLRALLRIKNSLTAEQQRKLLRIKQVGPDALR